jgi:hypothetical protein
MNSTSNMSAQTRQPGTRHSSLRRRLLLGGLAMMSALAVGLGGPVSTSATASPAPAPGSVFSGYKNQMRLTTAATQQVQVGALALPAGSYTISAKLYTTVPLPAGLVSTIRCVLKAANDYDETWLNHNAMIAAVPMSLNVVHTFAAPGSVVLTCGYVYTSGDTYLRFVKITAIATGSLVNGPMP